MRHVQRKHTQLEILKGPPQWKHRIMYGLAWIRFLVTNKTIRQRFSRVRKLRVKFISVSPNEWQKLFIHGNPHITLFLIFTAFYVWTHKSTVKIIDGSSRHGHQGRYFLTWHCDNTTSGLIRVNSTKVPKGLAEPNCNGAKNPTQNIRTASVKEVGTSRPRWWAIIQYKVIVRTSAKK